MTNMDIKIRTFFYPPFDRPFYLEQAHNTADDVAAEKTKRIVSELSAKKQRQTRPFIALAEEDTPEGYKYGAKWNHEQS